MSSIEDYDAPLDGRPFRALERTRLGIEDPLKEILAKAEEENKLKEAAKQKLVDEGRSAEEFEQDNDIGFTHPLLVRLIS